MKLFYNPLSSYSQKTLLGFYEKQVPFEPHLVNLMDAADKARFRKIYPLGKVPLLELSEGNSLPESTNILEYLDTHYPSGPRLIPADPEKGRQTRYFDRICDLYLNDPVGGLFFEGLKPEAQRNAERIETWKFELTTSYDRLEAHLVGKHWLMGEWFTLADCAAMPPLNYARQLFPYEKYPQLTAYWNRLSERASVRRVLDEAAPHLQRFQEFLKKAN